MKYIILQQSLLEGITKIPRVVLFDDALVHKLIAEGAMRSEKGLVPYSAGFWYVSLDYKTVIVSGHKAESLGIGPLPGDKEIIEKTLRGLGAHDLMVEAMMEELKELKELKRRFKELKGRLKGKGR